MTPVGVEPRTSRFRRSITTPYQIRPPVAMANNIFHRFIMGEQILPISVIFFCRYLNFIFAEMFIEYSSTFHNYDFVLIAYFDWLMGSENT